MEVTYQRLALIIDHPIDLIETPLNTCDHPLDGSGKLVHLLLGIGKDHILLTPLNLHQVTVDLRRQFDLGLGIGRRLERRSPVVIILLDDRRQQLLGLVGQRPPLALGQIKPTFVPVLPTDLPNLIVGLDILLIVALETGDQPSPFLVYLTIQLLQPCLQVCGQLLDRLGVAVHLLLGIGQDHILLATLDLHQVTVDPGRQLHLVPGHRRLLQSRGTLHILIHLLHQLRHRHLGLVKAVTTLSSR